jgi:phage shock protein A
LQGWTKELEGAKAYLEGLLSNVQKENSELQDKYARIEDELNNLSNEIAKLRYKYNQLINDPIIKMILKIKKLGQ